MSTPAPARNTVGAQPDAPPPAKTFARKEFHVKAVSPHGFPVTVVLRDTSFETLTQALDQLANAGYTPAER